jgi:hypothetical protein
MKTETIKKIFIAPYCHPDWAWAHTRLWHEKRYTLVFKEVLDIMNKNKDFRWYMDTFITQLEPFLRLCPERIDELKERIKQGRIEICGTYTNLRPNLVGEETFIRDIIYGKRELKNIFPDVKLSVYAGIVDVAIGHSQIPQLLSLGGYKYLRAWRPHAALSTKNIPYEFYWSSFDGSKILCSRGSYGGLCTTEVFTEKEKFKNNWQEAKEKFYKSEIDYAAKFSTTKVVWLSHGTDDARPLRSVGNDIKLDLLEFVEEWNKNEKTPIYWGTPLDYFRELEKNKEKIDEIKGPIDPIDVCYLTWNGPSGIWYLRIYCDEQITITEKLLIVTKMFGKQYPEKEIENLWKKILLFSAHAIQWLFKEDFEEIYNIAIKTKLDIEELKNKVLKEIISHINFEKEPIAVVFNTLEFSRKSFVEITISSVDKKITNKFILKDSSGKQLDYQIINYLSDYNNLWEIKILVKIELPAFGYNCIYFEEKNHESTISEGLLKMEAFNSNDLKKLENETACLNFDKGYLTEISFENKKYKTDIKNPFGNLKIYHMDSFDPNGILHIGRFIKEETVIWNKWWKSEDGNLRKIFCCEGKIGKHNVKMDTMIYNKEERIDFNIEINYLGEENAFVVFSLPVGFFDGKIYADIPFGIEEKNIEKEPYGRLPGLSWDNIERCIDGMFFAKSFVDYTDGKQGISLISYNAGKYFIWNKKEKVLSHILLRTFKIPVNTWEKDITEKIEGRGTHKFKCILYFHSNNWEKSKIYNIARSLITTPVPVQRFPVFSGDLSDIFSFFSIEPENIICTAFYKEEENIFLRMYEIEGKPTEVKIKLPFPIKKAYLVNFLEEEIKQKIHLNNKEILLNIQPYQIITIKMEMK